MSVTNIAMMIIMRFMPLSPPLQEISETRELWIQVIGIWETSLRLFALLEEIPFPSLQHIRSQSGLVCPVLSSPVQARHGNTGVSLAENHQDGHGLEGSTHEKKLRKLCLFRLKKSRQRGGFIVVYIYLTERQWKDRDRLYIVIKGDISWIWEILIR